MRRPARGGNTARIRDQAGEGKGKLSKGRARQLKQLVADNGRNARRTQRRLQKMLREIESSRKDRHDLLEAIASALEEGMKEVQDLMSGLTKFVRGAKKDQKKAADDAGDSPAEPPPEIQSASQTLSTLQKAAGGKFEVEVSQLIKQCKMGETAGGKTAKMTAAKPGPAAPEAPPINTMGIMPVIAVFGTIVLIKKALARGKRGD